MFKKKPQIKNLSPLRSSDRRKLADQIIAEYHVEVPAQPSEPHTEDSPVPTLANVRNALIPESCLSARFTTHAGANATLVSGTVYVGAQPGHEERILWISYGRDSKVYPTVYTLWQNPGLVPLLHTPDFVVEKLQSGADLMTPGLAGGPPWPERAKQGAVVAVARWDNRSVPVWVGVCEIDVSSLGDVRGLKGAAVKGVHWEGDELWNWSQTGSGGRPSPGEIEGWRPFIGGKGKALEDGIEQLNVEDEEDEAEADGGVSLQPTTNVNTNGHHDSPADAADDGEPEEEYEPTTEEIDHAFHQAFVYSLYNAKKNGSPPNYGIDFPIIPTFLISKMIQPHLRRQSPHYNIKKTSWKNTKKFIKYLDKSVLVKSKDRNGGETVILDVDFDDQQIRAFQPYKLPKPKPTTQPGSEAPESTSSSDPSLHQSYNLHTVYRASSKLVPDLVPSKTTHYTSAQISDFLKQYISNDPELTKNTSSARFIRIDPFISNNILTSEDGRILSTGEVARDVLLRKLLENAFLLTPYYMLLPSSTPVDLTSSSQKPRPYPPPRVLITLEKRTGNKTITKISGLEQFNINPAILGPELQKKCAGSASVGQLMGGKPGMLEILVQGDQREVVEKEVAKRGVKKDWVEFVDKSKKSGKK